MKSKSILRALAIAVALQLGMLAGSPQTNTYLYIGLETNVTLKPGRYIIAACGASGYTDAGIDGGIFGGRAALFLRSTVPANTRRFYRAQLSP